MNGIILLYSWENRARFAPKFPKEVACYEIIRHSRHGDNNTLKYLKMNELAIKIDLSHILIFKTNIQTEFDRLRIKNVLDASQKVLKWNIDMDDVDCVLRVVSDSLTPEQIITVIQYVGFECAELE
jgi:hypothetical protein